MASKPTPEFVYIKFVEGTSNRLKLRNLDILQRICAGQHATSKDFSLGTIGRLSEARGGISLRAIYNSASEDYKVLISAWRLYSGVKKEKEVDHELVTDDLLRKIEDPALRQLMQVIVIQRNRFRSELNLLKASQEPIKIYMGDSIQSGSNRLELSEAERSAVLRSLSKSFLDSEGWKEGPHGEIVNAAGRRVFDFGFTRALRKLL